MAIRIITLLALLIVSVSDCVDCFGCKYLNKQIVDFHAPNILLLDEFHKGRQNQSNIGGP